MAQWGLKPEDFETDDVEVWPENWRAVQVFLRLKTQWRVGMSGPVGLDYQAMPFVFRMESIARPEWPDLFAQVRVLEDAALDEMRR